MVQELSAIAGRDVTLSFTPMLAPMPRGILATTTMRTGQGVTLEDVRGAFDVYYASSPLFSSYPMGGGQQQQRPLEPTVLICRQQSMNGRGELWWSRQSTIWAGAAGQAVQNANLMCGFPETTGLDLLGVTP